MLKLIFLLYLFHCPFKVQSTGLTFSVCFVAVFSLYPAAIRPLAVSLITGEAACAGLLSHLSWEAALIS